MTADRRRHLHRHHPRRGRRPPDPLPRRGHQRHRHHPLPPRRRHHHLPRRRRAERRSPARSRCCEWFIADADYNAITGNPTADIVRPARHRLQRHGLSTTSTSTSAGTARRATPKPNWKFEMPQNHDLDMPGLLVEPVDEFAMQADWSEVAHGRSHALVGRLPAGRCRQHPDVPGPHAAQRRVPGHLHYLDLFDGTWREREGYDDNQFFKAENSAFDSSAHSPTSASRRRHPTTSDYAPLQAFLDGVALTGTAERNYLAGQHRHPAADQLRGRDGDHRARRLLDEELLPGPGPRTPADGRCSRGTSTTPWATSCCFVDSNFVTPAEPGDRTNPLMAALFATPEWRDMYFRRLRTLVNDLLATGRMEALYDAKRRRRPARDRARLRALALRRARELRAAAQPAVQRHRAPPERRSPRTRGCRATSPPPRTS